MKEIYLRTSLAFDIRSTLQAISVFSMEHHRHWFYQSICCLGFLRGFASLMTRLASLILRDSNNANLSLIEIN